MSACLFFILVDCWRSAQAADGGEMWVRVCQLFLGRLALQSVERLQGFETELCEVHLFACWTSHRFGGDVVMSWSHSPPCLNSLFERFFWLTLSVHSHSQGHQRSSLCGWMSSAGRCCSSVVLFLLYVSVLNSIPHSCLIHSLWLYIVKPIMTEMVEFILLLPQSLRLIRETE